MGDCAVMPGKFFHRLEFLLDVISKNQTIVSADSTDCVSWVKLDALDSFALTFITSFCDGVEVVVQHHKGAVKEAKNDQIACITECNNVTTALQLTVLRLAAGFKVPYSKHGVASKCEDFRSSGMGG